MDLVDAVILGIVEGLTEYLPVSSTGHLIVAQRLLGIEASEEANGFAIAVQSGAILAVLSLYRARAMSMARGLLGRDADGARLARQVVAAFVPAAVVGLLLDDWIEAQLFGVVPVIVGWTVGAVVMLAVDRRLRAGTREIGDLDLRGAVLIGLFQTLAMWPGTSRSLATILGGVAVGLTLPAAVEFSFLLGVVTLGAATAYKGLDAGGAMWSAYGPGPLLAGFVAAWGSAVLAVRGMVAWLERRGLGVFALWRLLVAGSLGAAIAFGWW